MADNDQFSRIEAFEREIRSDLRRVEEKIAECTKTPWPTVISVISVVVMIILGFLGLVNLRFESVMERIGVLDRAGVDTRASLEKTAIETIRRSELLATKEALEVQIRQTGKSMDDLSREIIIINADLIRRRSEFVEQVEMRAFEKHIDDRDKMLDAMIAERLHSTTFDAWKAERDKLIADLVSRVAALEKVGR